MHSGSLFGEEVLDDHFLHVTMSKVRSSYCFERLDAILTVFPDADEYSRGKRNGELAGRFESRQSTFGSLVRCAPVTFKICSKRFNHRSL